MTFWSALRAVSALVTMGSVIWFIGWLMGWRARGKEEKL